MTKVRVEDKLIAEVRALHKWYADLKDAPLVRCALQDYIEKEKTKGARVRLP